MVEEVQSGTLHLYLILDMYNVPFALPQFENPPGDPVTNFPTTLHTNSGEKVFETGTVKPAKTEHPLSHT